MSKSRAKKKQRQRARAADRVGATAGAPRGAGERAARRAPVRQAQTVAAARRSSRLDERDGVARPDPPWAPFPLTEIGMAVGIVLFGLGFVAGGANGLYLLAIGVLLLAVVAGELCLREHFTGFRSHSILLALLAVTAVHMVVFYAVTQGWRGPVALAVDLSVAGALAYGLQRRFRAAQAQAQAS